MAEKTNENRGKFLIGAVFIFIIASWVATWFLPHLFESAPPTGLLGEALGSREKAALSGDMFGSLNALFSGLAFAGLILALRMQQEELSLQRRELRDTREEFAKQTEIHDAHLSLLGRERAEREKLQKLAFEPFLMLRILEAYRDQGAFNLFNAGATIFDLEFLNPQFAGIPTTNFKASADTILEKGGHLRVHWELESTLPEGSVVSFEIAFTTGLNERKAAKLSFEFADEHLQYQTPPIVF